MSWYSQGAITLTNGSKAVTGTGTAWLDNVLDSNALQTPTGPYEIESVSANGLLQLVKPYAGPTAAGITYDIIPTQGLNIIVARQLGLLLSSLGQLKDAWQAGDLAEAADVLNKVDADLLALSNGSQLVGYDNATAQDVLDYVKPLQNYAALRAYSGRAKAVRITGSLARSTPDGTCGTFYRVDSDTTGVDNGGTVIVSINGKRWRRALEGYIDVRWFGATGDGSTDDWGALQKAADACVVSAYDVGRGGPTLLLPEALGYRVSAPVAVAAGVPVEFRNTSILYNGAANIAVLTLGEVANRTYRCRYSGLDVRRDGNITRNNEADIGIRIINAFFCDIELRGARGFKIGWQLNGVNPGEGCYYNRVQLGYFFGNSINGDLKGGDGVNAGWVNENVFIGGECQGGVTDAYERYGIRVWNAPAGALYNDNNVFIKPSFEMNGPAGSTSIPFLILHSQALRVINARQEGPNSTIFARIENNSKNTDLHVGHQQTSELAIQDLSIEKSTTLHCQKTNWSYHGRAIYTTETLGRSAGKYNATRYHLPGLNFYRQADTTLLNNSGPLTVAGHKVTVSATDAIARMIDTTRCKKFVVDIDSDLGEHPWIVVQAFDAAGNVLTSAGAGHPYVSGPGFGWSAGWNGYAYASSISTERLFTVGDDVKFVRVGIYNGKLRGFSLHALGVNHQFAATYSGYEDCAPGGNLAIAAPTDGSYAVGRVLFHATPVAGGNVGWVQTTSGWKTWGAISA